MKIGFKVVGLAVMIIILALILTGCGGGSKNGGTGTLKLSMTDAPGENYSAVYITFSEVRISQSTDANTSSWLTLTSTPQTLNLMTLTNGTLQELGVKQLPAGQYNQIRFYVTSAQVVIGTQTYDITLPSTMFRTVGSFSLVNGVTTELVVDFNVAESIVKMGNGNYHLKPTTRLAAINTTGGISGTVTLNPVSLTAPITVSTTDAANNAIATICKSDGTYLLGYLPPGTYNLKVEAPGYTTNTAVQGIVVTAGSITTAPSVTLTAAAPTPPPATTPQPSIAP